MVDAHVGFEAIAAVLNTLVVEMLVLPLAHVGFEAAAAVLNTLLVEMLVLPLDSTTLNVTVSVMVAACVGIPTALPVDDSAAVLLQQFSVGSLGLRQQ